jgi:hypothetical protein
MWTHASVVADRTASARKRAGMRRIAPFLLTGLLLLPAVSVMAADYEEPDIEFFFYPVVTRRPVVERVVIDPEREEELSTGLAVGYPAWRWFIPFVELRTVTPTRGEDHGPRCTWSPDST